MREAAQIAPRSGGVASVDRGLEVLTRDQCVALLGGKSLGRVGVTLAALPAILPVNYVVRGGFVYFRTGEGTKLAAAVDRTVVAFEVDDSDPAEHTGWSVLVVGRSEVVPAEELADLGALPVRPWPAGDRSHLVRVSMEKVSGRRVRHDLPSGFSSPDVVSGTSAHERER